MHKKLKLLQALEEREMKFGAGADYSGISHGFF